MSNYKDELEMVRTGFRVLFSESQVCKTRLASSSTMDYEPSLYRLCPNNASVLVTI